MAEAAELSNDWTVLDQKLKTFNRLMTTKAAIGQTPKELIWTLNKAKLYRYIPVVPAEERYPIPLDPHFRLDESSHDHGSAPRPQLRGIHGWQRL